MIQKQMEYLMIFFQIFSFVWLFEFPTIAFILELTYAHDLAIVDSGVGIKANIGPAGKSSMQGVSPNSK